MATTKVTSELTGVVNPCSVTSSGRPAVVVDDPAEAIAALDPPGRQCEHFSRLTGSTLRDPLVRPGVVGNGQ